ncbi:MAG: mechanosensitive ion channel family protein [Chloroflexi bacterium]|nr:mechanosensitive ion channel family protein [Chloroflexota bacterium]
MLPDFAVGNPGWEAIFATSIFGASLIIAALVYFVFNKILKVLAGRTRTTLDDLIVKAVGRPIFIFVLVFGPYTALTATTYLDDHQDQLDRGLLSAEIIIVGYAIKRVLGALIKWYGTAIAGRTTTSWDERVLPMFQRISNVVIYAVVLLLVLDAQGLDISPLIAGMGISGLALALAVQPTLSNFIAGTYTVTESGIGVGDYIELDDGKTAGWVEEVGWRTTKVRNFWNNLIIIPNSRLSDSVVTNYQAPNPAVFAFVTGGVSYESDLDHVDRVAMEVTNKVLNESDGADLTYKPVLRFRAFGDSNIDFMVIFKVRGFVDQFIIKDRIIRGLHRRFGEEGIEINYPVRKLVFPKEFNVKTSPLANVEPSQVEPPKVEPPQMESPQGDPDS